MEAPISKWLGADYRDALRVPDSPSRIDTTVPITPVVSLNNGLPRPQANQRLRWGLINVSGAFSSQVQIATVLSTRRIYFVSLMTMAVSAHTVAYALFDGTSGGAPAPTANTLMADQTGDLAYHYVPATVGTRQETQPSLPVEAKYGLRLDISAPAGTNHYVLIYWIEEEV